MKRKSSLSKTRKFGKETYHLSFWRYSKTDAKQDANSKRAEGFKARIVKSKTGNKPSYDVFVKEKR